MNLKNEQEFAYNVINAQIMADIREKGLYPNPSKEYADPSLARIASRMWELKEELARLDGLIVSIALDEERKELCLDGKWQLR